MKHIIYGAGVFFLLLLLLASCDKEELTSENPFEPAAGTSSVTNANNRNGGRDDNDGNNGGRGGGNNQLSALPILDLDPLDNPSTQERIELGRNLFWDPILSGTKDVACATCHHPSRGYTDGIDLSIGVGGIGLAEYRIPGPAGFVKRNAPTILNTAYNGINQNGRISPENAEMFWDNRARSLETQALLPIHSFVEMRGGAFSEDTTIDSIVARLEAIKRYRNDFREAFPGNSITGDKIAQAIAAFERSLNTPNSRFDQYMHGDEQALSPREIQGMRLFEQVGCVDCHNGPMLSDYDLHVLGVRDNPKLNELDRGDGQDAFRTPSLRNLAMTGPYMHNGTLSSLQEVLDFYDDHHRQSANPNVRNNQLDRNLRNLGNLNQNSKNAIISFLESLIDEQFDQTIPTRTLSGLPVGGNINR